jgi:hypothetical protein
MRTAVVMTTHRFDPPVLDEFSRIRDALSPGDRAFLLCDGSGAPPPEEVAPLAHVFDTAIVTRKAARIVGEGILRNFHLAWLDLFEAHPGFDAYWFIEYDVVYSGAWRDFLDDFRQLPHDLLATHLRTHAQEPGWYWWDEIRPPDAVLPAERLIRGFLPVARVSRKGLERLRDAVAEGWTGFAEGLVPTILREAGLTLGDIGGDGPFVVPGFENRYYTSASDPAGLLLDRGTMRYRPPIRFPRIAPGRLYHPVKPESTGSDGWAGGKPAPEVRELALREAEPSLPRLRGYTAFDLRARILTGLSATHLRALPICSVCSERYRPVHAVFRESLLGIGYPEERILTRFYDDDAFDATGFRTPSWHHALREKVRFALEQARANRGRCIIVSDVDIQFFPPFARVDFARTLRERKLDMLFMRELTEQEPPVNAGFIAVRCNDRVIGLLEAVSWRIADERLPFGDQTAFADALASGAHGVRYGTIGEDKVVWGLRCPGLVSDAWFHHAVCTATGEEKLAQFEAVRALRAAPAGPVRAAWRRIAGKRKALTRPIRSWIRRRIPGGDQPPSAASNSDR